MKQKEWKKKLEKIDNYNSVFNEKENRLGLGGRAQRHFFLCGEKDSGKELFAEMSHQAGLLHKNPFVTWHIEDKDEENIQKKLFGFVNEKKILQPGLVEQAKGGTLYLHGFDSLEIDFFKEIIRFVERQSYIPVGSKESINSDVRVILATSLKEYHHQEEIFGMLAFSSFDFLHSPIRLCPLNQRSNEIKGIVDYLLERISLDTDKKRMKPAEDCIGSLENYDWPGNVPELIEEIETAVGNVQIDTVLRSIHLSKKVRFAPPKKQPEKDKTVIEIADKYNRRIEQDDLNTYLYFYQDGDDGDFWQVGEVGNSRTIKHIKGMAFINFLLMHPNQPINAYTLYHLGKIPLDGTVEYDHNSEFNREHDRQIKILEGETKDCSLEELDQFIENIEKKLQDIDLNEGEDSRDTRELLKLLKQIKADRINKKIGRKTSDEIDPLIKKSRPTVSKRIKDALDNIYEKLPEMKVYLNKETISKGYTFTYESAINEPHWILSDEDAKEFKEKFYL